MTVPRKCSEMTALAITPSFRSDQSPRQEAAIFQQIEASARDSWVWGASGGAKVRPQHLQDFRLGIPIFQIMTQDRASLARNAAGNFTVSLLHSLLQPHPDFVRWLSAFQSLTESPLRTKRPVARDLGQLVKPLPHKHENLSSYSRHRWKSLAVSVTPGLRDRGSLWLVVSQSNQSASSKFSERPWLKIEGREWQKKTPMLTSDLHKIKHLSIPGVG